MARRRQRRRNQAFAPGGPRERPSRLTQGQKYLIAGGSALALILVVGAIASAADTKNKRARKRLVNADQSCSSPTVVESSLWQDQIRGAVRQSGELGIFDPFDVTSALITGAAPTCTVYPKNTRNPGEAKFYAQTFLAVINSATGQNLISAQQATTWNSMMFTWANAQGVNVNQL